MSSPESESSKEAKMREKYDRQIRLWGFDGQKEIESAVVCALGSDVINSEILKNMVLHAVGHIIIVDDAKVSEKDVGLNFLVEPSCVGQNRADVVAKLLSEMNPDPEIRTIIRSPTDLSVFDDPLFTSKVIVVSYGNHSPAFLSQLSDRVRAKGMKQLHTQTSGFYGAFYLDAGNHFALEGGTEAESPYDFRIENPFPALKQYLESYNVAEIAPSELERLPYLVPLYWARQQYLQKTGAKTVPYSKKEELINILTAFDPNDAYEVISEAKANALRGCEKLGLPPNMETTFQEINEFPKEDVFWRVVRAAKEFYDEEHVPPHYGSIPDLSCSSQEFIKLKQIYKEQSELDTEKLIKKLPDVDREFIKNYVKNSWRSIGIKFRPLKETIMSQYSGFAYDDNTITAQNIQTLFICSRIFAGKHDRAPTIGDEKELYELCKENGAYQTDLEKIENICKEFCRFKNEVLPSVAATLAAIASQELTKVIIHKATPNKGIVTYDAIHGFINQN